MRRAAVLFLWPSAPLAPGGNGYAGGAISSCVTKFAHRAAALKRRYRGKGQYDFARREAEQFLENEVPENETSAWIEQGNNAVALAQLLQFFEIEPDDSLKSLITNKLVRTLDDTNYDGTTRLSAAVVLAQRGDQFLERTFATVDKVLQEFSRQSGDGSMDYHEAWNLIEYAAKVLQRGAKHAPNAMSEALTQVAIARLQQTPPSEMVRLQSSLLRVYSWLVRAGKGAEANHFLAALLDHSGEFHSYDFSTLMNSCLRHHQLLPFPLQLQQRLARAGLMYSTTANGRDVASIVGSVAKMVGSLQPGKNGMTQHGVCELGGRLSTLLEEYEPLVMSFFDSNDKLHWSHCDDMTSIAFAYEMGGRLRYRNVFVAYQAYVGKHVGRFEPPQLAMAAGILRRSNLLSQELAARLGERIETVLGEFSLSEISHICATFAPMSPSWMPEAKAVASRLLQPECSSYTKLLLAIAFSDDEALHAQVDLRDVSGRQLVDALSLAYGTKFDSLLVAELITRLQAAQERFSPDEIRMLQASGRPELQSACMVFLSSRFAEAEWTSDTLYCLPLAANLIPHARDGAKALEAAKTVSVSPEQFVSLVELMTSVFGAGAGEAIENFVVSGGMDLLGAERIRIGTVLRYLEAVRPLPTMHPSAEWLAHFNEKFQKRLGHITPKETESLLGSLCALYGSVTQQPLLQQVVTEVVLGPYGRLSQPDETAARITLLIVQAQQGALRPALTLSTPMVNSIRSNADAYEPQLREAVVNMSVPQDAEQKRVGRFTLKMTKTLEKSVPTDEQCVSQDLNESLAVDPFSESAMDAPGTGDAKSSPLVNATAVVPSIVCDSSRTKNPSSVSGTANGEIIPSRDTTSTTEMSTDGPGNVNYAQGSPIQPPQAQSQPVVSQVRMPAATEGSMTSFGSTLWSMFKNPLSSSEDEQQTHHFGTSSSVSSPVTLRSPEARPVSSFMGFVDHDNQTASVVAASAPEGSRMTTGQEGRFGQQLEPTRHEKGQPRRTKLPVSEAHSGAQKDGAGGANSGQHGKQESPKYELGNWGAQPSANTSWLSSSSMWGVSDQDPAIPQSSVATLGDTWSSARKHSQQVFGVSNRNNAYGCAADQQQLDSRYPNQFLDQQCNQQGNSLQRPQHFQQPQQFPFGQQHNMQLQPWSQQQQRYPQNQQQQPWSQQPQNQQQQHWPDQQQRQWSQQPQHQTRHQPLEHQQGQQHQQLFHNEQHSQQKPFTNQQRQHQSGFVVGSSPFGASTVQMIPPINAMAQKGGVSGVGGMLYFGLSGSARARPVITKVIQKTPQSLPETPQNDGNTQTLTQETEGVDAGYQRARKWAKGAQSKPRDDDEEEGEEETTEGTEEEEEPPRKKGPHLQLKDRGPKRPNKVRKDLKEWLDSPPEKELQPMRASRKKKATAPATPTKGKTKEVVKRGKAKETTTVTKGTAAPKGKAPAKKATPAKNAKAAATEKAKSGNKEVAKATRGRKPKVPAAKAPAKKPVSETPATKKKAGKKLAEKAKGGKK